MIKIKRALISVSDKKGIIDFAKTLIKFNVEILSTGGTAKLLAENNISVIEVSDYTGFPEMLDGRVKTLHPKIHGGILGKRDDEKHLQTMIKSDIPLIDLVVVNLYPFEATISKENCPLSEAIENIDIGGPAMIRSSAKNYNGVAVVTDASDYKMIEDALEKNDGALNLECRFNLAKKAFEHTAKYDSAISNYLNGLDTNKNVTYPNKLNLIFNKKMDLRYGENPHQSASFYVDEIANKGSLASFKQLQGKELSYNNLNDADTAWECVKSFKLPSCVIVKHANPCGVGSSQDLLNAYKKAFSTDPTSAFGGIIACNTILDKNTASQIITQFVEVVIAPSYDPESLKIFESKPNIRLLEVTLDSNFNTFELKKIGGGLLVQSPDNFNIDMNHCKIVSKLKPNEEQMDDMLFAWRVAKYVKSNAIVFCKNNQTLGIGAGQMSRVDSTKIASIKAQNANLNLTNSVVASDAFFPFRDGIDVLAAAGAKCVIQPGGSLRDEEVISAADELGLVMLFTGYRHFRH
ncbi:MAG TPA: bifunctional phosphoribosylaminoimidazolecarboxamide formyltransferase/inosine monophosphate cyclohydrolase [Methylophilaceae bacterium]|jgi:phosphoribosylaminoimidazolecarboxamide formyltransferase/IMP cyclohydrolase|nr:bifunctional phosphoribosylaminoimidazolecarboxamide formyltransferase/inosine monophosphate cyclohydrolase [Methylophilaceae bacterium]HAP05069.1 bifunctional phosphoribosylaminoimidazolecarboxamide formyltransferase/inosine monophosphate cyclohydrolase [Methylophilaceae bacterium]HCB68519.1 bifunctional phosphoribosylaminoimidazolecarboxamide formyltransferase/inosine monophosphate cyclohydrolase [Methylophilaceae bacterium]HCC72875.1 bifunctional phosphoribosylaminoimidazolecarboxamide for